MDKKELKEIQEKLKKVFDVSADKATSDKYSGETVPLSAIAAAEAAKAICEIEKML